MKTALFILIVATCCWGQTTTQKDPDGNRLLEDCGALIRESDNGFQRPDPNQYGAGWCTGYVRGFVDGLDSMAMAISTTYEEYVAHKSTYICLPQEDTIGQDIRVIVKFVNDHPERLHENAGTLVFGALKNAFPCAPKPPANKSTAKTH